MDSFYSNEELKGLGLASYGENVKISKKASIYSAENIAIGNNVRIDDFCILSGAIKIGDYVHIAAYTGLFGGTAGIQIRDFANISSRVCIYAISDDYSGETMTNPMISNNYKKLQNEPVIIEKHVIIGSGSTVLPGVEIKEGCAIGAMSLCKKSTEPFGIYAGIPAKRIKERSKDLLNLENSFFS